MTRVPAASLVRLHLEPEGPSPGYASSALLTGLPDAAIAAVLESTGPGSGNRLTGRVWPNFAPPHDAASALRAYDPASPGSPTSSRRTTRTACCRPGATPAPEPSRPDLGGRFPTRGTGLQHVPDLPKR